MFYPPIYPYHFGEGQEGGTNNNSVLALLQLWTEGLLAQVSTLEPMALLFIRVSVLKTNLHILVCDFFSNK